MRIGICIERTSFRQWHVVLRQRLERSMPDTEVYIRVDDSRHAVAGIDFLLAFEKTTLHRGASSICDPAAPAPETMREDPSSRPDVLIDLAGRATSADAALILRRKRFGAIPVVENRRLVGILAKADILTTFLDTLDIEGIGVRVEVVLPRSAAEVLRLMRRIGEMELEIRSLVLSSRGKEYVAFLRLSTIDVATVKEKLRESGFRVPDIAEFLE